MKSLVDTECEKLVNNFSGWYPIDEGIHREWESTFIRDNKKYKARLHYGGIEEINDFLPKARKALSEAIEV